MSSDFQQFGRALLGNGYLIIPIKPGHKRPALDNWQASRLGTADLTPVPGLRRRRAARSGLSF